VAVTVRVQVADDPATAWRALADIPAWPEWNPTCADAQIDTPEVAKDTRARLQLRHPRGRLFWTEIRLTEVDPGRTLAWVTRAFGLRATTRVVMEPVSNGTAVTLTSASRGPLAFTYRLMFPEKAQGLLWSGALTALAHRRRSTESDAPQHDAGEPAD